MHVNLRQLTRSNPNLELFNVTPNAKIDQIPSIRSQDTERKQKFEIAKGHNFVLNLQKLTRYNPNLELVKVNVHAKFDQIPLIRS